MPTKPTLAPRENHQLKILWQTHSRELVDVKFDESKNAAAAAAILSPDAYGKAVRLYLFFVAFLEAAILRDNHPEASSSARKDPFIRDYQSSALRPYAAWALTTTTASANNTPGSNHPPSPHQIRLQSGRRVLALHHEDFLQELNTFELRGSEPTSDFNKESFGECKEHDKKSYCLIARNFHLLLSDCATITLYLVSQQVHFFISFQLML